MPARPPCGATVRFTPNWCATWGGDPSEAKSIIAKRSTTLAIWCEDVEARMAKGGDIDIGEFTTATNALRRLLADIGLERKARDITPTLEQYLRENHGEAA